MCSEPPGSGGISWTLWTRCAFPNPWNCSVFCAQGRNRTADTGIFNPRLVLPKPRESRGRQRPREANVTNTSQLSIKEPKVAEAVTPDGGLRRASNAKPRLRVPPRARPSASAHPIVATKNPTAASAPTNPRQTLLTSLTDAIRDATGSGDMGAARIAMEALTKLMGEAGTASGAVVDLAEETRKRRR